MAEAPREKRFRDLVKKMGCKVIKFTDPGQDGGPDRLVLTPVGIPIWIEFKDVYEEPRPTQVNYSSQLMEMGFLSIWACDPDRAADLVALIMSSNDPHRFVQMMIDGQKMMVKDDRQI